MSHPVEEDDWVFDTVKQATYRQQQQSLVIPKHTIKRRKLSRIISDEEAASAAAMMQTLDINSAPLTSDSPTYPEDRSTTIRTPKPSTGSPTQHRKSSALTARKISGSNTPTARRLSRQNSGTTSTARRISGHAKQPLGLDMSFGNGTSTVRQFRRVSSGGNYGPPQRPHTAGAVAIAEDDDFFDASSDTENQHPQSLPAQPIVATKQSILGRRAYAKCVDPALQESCASTAPGPKQAALAKLAEAWSLLDAVDPEGEVLLLRALFERVQADPRLAAQIMPSRVATTQLASLRLGDSPIKRSSAIMTPPSDNDMDTLTTPPTSPQKGHRRDSSTPKLVISSQNPHLRDIAQRRQSAVGIIAERDEPTVTVEKKRPGSSGKAGLAADKLPGNVVPGLEHVGLLADALYGRWSEGLRMRWPLT